MKVIAIISVILVLFALIFPIAACWDRGEPPNSGPSVPDAPAGDGADSLFYVPPAAPQTVRDTEAQVTLLVDGETRQISVRDYLMGAVAAEMPASFEPEALKAQAVALRTYLARKLVHPSSAHPEADICADSGCCAAWRSQEQLREKWGDAYGDNAARIAAAVEGTDGMILSFGGEPILAVFHSSSAGRTEDASEVWQSALPYLVSVESPETADTVPNYVVSVAFTPEEFCETVSAAHPEASFSGAPETWIADPVLTPSGRLDQVTVGGVTLTGREVRSLFGLRSTAVTFDVSAEAVTVTSTGYGHGVGMSQYGAQTMALQGKGFEEILENYYPGAELVTPSASA